MTHGSKKLRTMAQSLSKDFPRASRQQPGFHNTSPTMSRLTLPVYSLQLCVPQVGGATSGSFFSISFYFVFFFFSLYSPFPQAPTYTMPPFLLWLLLVLSLLSVPTPLCTNLSQDQLQSTPIKPNTGPAGKTMPGPCLSPLISQPSPAVSSGPCGTRAAGPCTSKTRAMLG